MVGVDGGWALARGACAVGVVCMGLVGAPGCALSHSRALEERDAAVASDAGAPSERECDDGDPCTVGVSIGGECHFEPAPDGTPCDDGDFCTLGDGCQAGRCEPGYRAEGSLARLGELQSHYGAIEAVGPGRFLVVSPRLRAAHLQLVERTADGLSTVASWTDSTPSVVSRADTRILPFGDSHLVGVIDRSLTHSPLAIFSVADDDIELVTTLDSPRFGAGYGRHFWLCRGSWGLERIDVDDPDGPAPSLETPGGCGSVSVNDDGSRVYARMGASVGVVDASPAAHGDDPVLLEEVPGSSVSVPGFSGGHLLLIDSGAVRVFREREGAPAVEEEAVVPVEGVRAATLIGQRLLIEGSREAGGAAEDFIALYDALGPDAPGLLDEVVLQRVPYRSPRTAKFTSATDGETLITRVGARMFDVGGDELTEVRARTLEPLEWLSRADGGGVHAHGPFGAAAVDLSDPEAPVFRGGGSFGAQDHAWLGLVDARLHPVLVRARISSVVDFAASRRLHFVSQPGPDSLSLWSLDHDASRGGIGSVSLPLSGGLMVAGDALYRRTDPEDGRVRLLGYDLEALRNGSASALFDLHVASDSSASFDVDPRAQVMVVSVAEEDPDGEEEAALLWLDLSSSSPAVVDEEPVATRYASLRVVGDRVAARAGFDVVFHERGSGEVGRVENDRFRPPDALVFDGRVAHYVVRADSAETTHELRAARFGADEQAVLPLDDLPSSLVATEAGLVLGSEGQLVTVHPHCP